MNLFSRACITMFLLLSIPVCLGAQDQGTSAPGTSEMYNVLVPGFTAGVIDMLGAGNPMYVGGSIRFDLVYTLNKNQPRAGFVERGRNELYIDIGLFGLLPADGGASNLLFRYVLGFTTSFETPRSLNRNFLIPYVGIELGGIYIGGSGNGFLAVPVLGLNIVTLQTFTMSCDTGLILNTVSFEKFLGLRTELHINFVI
jgi:hypothetical protein